jgi:hypothetical protein
MMELSDIKGLTTGQIKRLTKDGWTVKRLATASAAQLAPYKISSMAAWKIISEARKLVHETGLAESLAAVPAPPAPPPPPSDVEVLETAYRQLVPDAPPLEMSVRVKRIWLQNRLRELGHA